MRCLNCNAEMVNYDVTTKKAELSYDLCEKCGSLWLDAGELNKMAFQVAGSIEFCSEEVDKTARPQRKCQRCDTRPLHAGAHKIRRLSEMSWHVARRGRTQKAQEHR